MNLIKRMADSCQDVCRDNAWRAYYILSQISKPTSQAMSALEKLLVNEAGKETGDYAAMLIGKWEDPKKLAENYARRMMAGNDPDREQDGIMILNKGDMIRPSDWPFIVARATKDSSGNSALWSLDEERREEVIPHIINRIADPWARSREKLLQALHFWDVEPTDKLWNAVGALLNPSSRASDDERAEALYLTTGWDDAPSTAIEPDAVLKNLNSFEPWLVGAQLKALARHWPSTIELPSEIAEQVMKLAGNSHFGNDEANRVLLAFRGMGSVQSALKGKWGQSSDSKDRKAISGAVLALSDVDTISPEALTAFARNSDSCEVGDLAESVERRGNARAVFNDYIFNIPFKVFSDHWDAALVEMRGRRLTPEQVVSFLDKVGSDGMDPERVPHTVLSEWARRSEVKKAVKLILAGTSGEKEGFPLVNWSYVGAIRLLGFMGDETWARPLLTKKLDRFINDHERTAAVESLDRLDIAPTPLLVEKLLAWSAEANTSGRKYDDAPQAIQNYLAGRMAVERG